VHHIAFRAPDGQTQARWRQELVDAGVQVTEIIDRQYFTSIYFREPGGVLREIATDQPGFTVDEPLLELGRSLKLPPWLEPNREQIEAALPPAAQPGHRRHRRPTPRRRREPRRAGGMTGATLQRQPWESASALLVIAAAFLWRRPHPTTSGNGSSGPSPPSPRARSQSTRARCAAPPARNGLRAAHGHCHGVGPVEGRPFGLP
jgi:hypothetical protein